MSERDLLRKLASQAGKNRVSNLATLERKLPDTETLETALRNGKLALLDLGRGLVVPTVSGLLELNYALGEHFTELCRWLQRRYRKRASDNVDVEEILSYTIWLEAQQFPPLPEDILTMLWALAGLRSARVIIPCIDKVDERGNEPRWRMQAFAIERAILRFPTDAADVIEREENALRELAAKEESLDGLEVPDFSFMHNESLRAIVERDYNEVQLCVASEAWKATIILCGSAMEALLLDKIMGNEEQVRSGDSRGREDLRKLALAQMNETAAKNRWLSEGSRTLNDALRNHRNLVHPYKEMSQNIKVERLKQQWPLES